jgi:hypothetical protein
MQEYNSNANASMRNKITPIKMDESDEQIQESRSPIHEKERESKQVSMEQNHLKKLK